MNNPEKQKPQGQEAEPLTNEQLLSLVRETHDKYLPIVYSDAGDALVKMFKDDYPDWQEYRLFHVLIGSSIPPGAVSREGDTPDNAIQALIQKIKEASS
ncbi:MAG: hypothetical protein COU11_01735 [Candidatus Harrisonbacteria bacterium CG10_big_fil_rev_8_21_14_0_10_49_15]|uniref:Uncharacterized protein n=1 Tax=Candidatus Harrisonbacteria bacterium CG10_big_fil_rev_8_21_14_0_10_49_15 TaxID=1974587 RepID=A0A2H0ULB7_9BACT|nr:MAG: hypothetical protein COU11_01735 [Candidatus Harrisonbacteria bacterium CG10_big_fil_rev_8_21_14_0_10_49_15]